ncbi:conserved protein of unknown function (plasmid) [Rhodovastum atsumiense]|uniref:Uncharacterized protein n=1 Tax=Rhodovastum atsumiense TaxID=504468 RepID=A0A5M6IUA1_9PROT|nr:hypothetical protein [Rhodovastum atsumiense]KAA5611852.1 hypothetical protein F1189_12525 [Rhodovastum atsumiense]CAH2606172.1 conserved protein of unknown function [Rhodovastum atsumiense]
MHTTEAVAACVYPHLERLGIGEAQIEADTHEVTVAYRGNWASVRLPNPPRSMPAELREEILAASAPSFAFGGEGKSTLGALNGTAFPDADAVARCLLSHLEGLPKLTLAQARGGAAADRVLAEVTRALAEACPRANWRRGDNDTVWADLFDGGFAGVQALPLWGYVARARNARGEDIKHPGRVHNGLRSAAEEALQLLGMPNNTAA